MARETVIDNEYAMMWYYPDKKIVHHKIIKFIWGQTFYDFLLTGTELLRKHRVRKWLSDDRDCPVLRQEDMDWGQVNWFPQTIKAGWKYWAIVLPTKAAGKMNLKALAEDYSKAGLTAKFFTDPDEAMAWLEAQN